MELPEVPFTITGCDHIDETPREKIYRIKHIAADYTQDCGRYMRVCEKCRMNVQANLLQMYFDFMNDAENVVVADCSFGEGHKFPGFASYAVLEEIDILRETEKDLKNG